MTETKLLLCLDSRELTFSRRSFPTGTASHANDASVVAASAGTSTGSGATAGMISANDLAMVLSQNNENLLKEIHSYQMSSGGGGGAQMGQGVDMNAYNQMMFNMQSQQQQYMQQMQQQQQQVQHSAGKYAHHQQPQAAPQHHHVTYSADLPPSGKPPTASASAANASTRAGVADVSTPAKGSSTSSNLRLDVSTPLPHHHQQTQQGMYTPAPNNNLNMNFNPQQGMYTGGGGGGNMWTPMMGRGGMPFAPAPMMGTPYGGMNAGM